MRQPSKLRLALRRDLQTTFCKWCYRCAWSTRSGLWARDLAAHAMKWCSMKRNRPSAAFQVRGATRGQGRTHGDQRTWWRALRIAERRQTFTLRLLVQVTVYQMG